MTVSILGIDIAKNTFQLHGTDNSGKTILKKRLPRHKIAAHVANLPVSTIVMESCGGAEVILLPGNEIYRLWQILFRPGTTIVDHSKGSPAGMEIKSEGAECRIIASQQPDFLDSLRL